jgi:hypothetical protein
LDVFLKLNAVLSVKLQPKHNHREKWNKRTYPCAQQRFSDLEIDAAMPDAPIPIIDKASSARQFKGKSVSQ